MTTSRRLAPLPLLLIGLAALCAALALIPWVVQVQNQEVTATAAATGANPPAQPTNLQPSAVHDSVTLTWTASTDQTVTHYAILRSNPDTDATQVFHVILQPSKRFGEAVGLLAASVGSVHRDNFTQFDENGSHDDEVYGEEKTKVLGGDNDGWTGTRPIWRDVGTVQQGA